MATNPRPDDRAAFAADVIHAQIGALADASTQRHRLAPGSAEYQTALEIEERLAEHVWKLATVHRPNGPEAEPT